MRLACPLCTVTELMLVLAERTSVARPVSWFEIASMDGERTQPGHASAVVVDLDLSQKMEAPARMGVRIQTWW